MQILHIIYIIMIALEYSSEAADLADGRVTFVAVFCGIRTSTCHGETGGREERLQCCLHVACLLLTSGCRHELQVKISSSWC